MQFVRKQSDEYIDLRPRDLCDVVRSVCNLQLCNLNESNKWMLKELRVLAKRAAFCLGDMDTKSSESVRDSFAMVDFYDADLVNAMKKHKLVKGGDKK